MPPHHKLCQVHDYEIQNGRLVLNHRNFIIRGSYLQKSSNSIGYRKSVEIPINGRTALDPADAWLLAYLRNCVEIPRCLSTDTPLTLSAKTIYDPLEAYGPNNPKFLNIVLDSRGATQICKFVGTIKISLILLKQAEKLAIEAFRQSK